MGISPCAPTPPQPGIVTFDPAEFVTFYPEFATVAAGVLSRNFQRATLQLDNSCGSRVKNAAKREILLGMLTAHLVALDPNGGANGNPAQGIVGRIDSATEGSVSATAQLSSQVSMSQAYYAQTSYGLEYWQATARFRTAVYIPAPCDPCSPGGNAAGFEGTAWNIGPVGTGFCGPNGGSS